MRHDAGAVRVYRMLIVLLGVFAESIIIGDILTGDNDAARHFSFFTVQSNVLAILVYSAAVIWRRAELPRWFDALRGAAVFYMTMTMVIYLLFLAGPGELFSLDVPVSNLMQHRIVPLLILLDWLLVAETGRPRIRRFIVWLVYPVVYVVASLVRGAIDGVYLYPFFEVTNGDYLALVPTLSLIIAGFIVGAFVVSSIGVLRARMSNSR